MTRILLFEFASAGGKVLGEPPPESLLVEGGAMLAALAEDFAKTPACDVKIALSEAELASLAPRFDWTLIIAPEIGGELSRLTSLPDMRLLGGSRAAIRIAADKTWTAEHLSAHNVRGTAIPTSEGPAVCKPRDGAGSIGVQFCRGVNSAAPKNYRLEEFYPGLAASCAVLCGPHGHFPLAACVQHLSDDGVFAYLGGEILTDPALAARAQNLALAAIRALPGPIGYFGVDLVLGSAADGSADVVIEINPRLTTSYIGLRAATDVNLAAAMLAVAKGDNPRLSCNWRPVRFFADGRVAEMMGSEST